MKIPINTTLTGSKFAKELTILFDKIIEAKNSSVDRQSRISNALAKAKSLKNDFTKCIITHSGIIPQPLIFKADGSCNISVMILLGDDPKTLNEKFNKNKTINDFKDNRFWPLTIANHAYDGVAASYFYPDNYSVKELSDLKKLSEAYDERLSKLKAGTMFLGKPVSGIVSFDLAVTILAQEFIGTKVESATAQECSAILLHEIGHALQLCKLAVDQYYKMSHFQSVISDNMLGDKLSNKDKVRIVLSNTKSDRVENEIFFDEGSTLHTVLGYLALIINGTVALILLNLVTYGVLLNWLLTVIAVPIRNFTLKMGQDYKSGDIAKSTANRYLQEFDADNYVAEHGLSSHLITSLNKLNKAMTMLGGRVGHVDTDVQHMFALIHASIWKFETMVFHNDPSDGVHGTTKKRALNLLNKNIELVKRQNLSKPELIYIIKEYDNLRYLINTSYANNYYTVFMGAVKRFIRLVTKVIISPLGLADVTQAKETIDEFKGVYKTLSNNRIYLELARGKVSK